MGKVKEMLLGECGCLCGCDCDYDYEPEVLVKKTHEGAIIPKYTHDTDSCADMYANTQLTSNSDKIVVKVGERKLIKTGISIGLPLGYEAQVRPRSGLAYKKGIYVHLGTIDNSYRGDVGILLFNLGDEDFVIEHGDRIAQLAIVPISQHTFKEVEDLDSTDRGVTGFGDSGVK